MLVFQRDQKFGNERVGHHSNVDWTIWWQAINCTAPSVYSVDNTSRSFVSFAVCERQAEAEPRKFRIKNYCKNNRSLPDANETGQERIFSYAAGISTWLWTHRDYGQMSFATPRPAAISTNTSISLETNKFVLPTRLVNILWWILIFIIILRT